MAEPLEIMVVRKNKDTTLFADRMYDTPKVHLGNTESVRVETSVPGARSLAITYVNIPDSSIVENFRAFAKTIGTGYDIPSARTEFYLSLSDNTRVLLMDK
ncbi:MAG: hypothetical protein AABY01_00495 [Nanoarchaeota archaeon]